MDVVRTLIFGLVGGAILAALGACSARPPAVPRQSAGPAGEGGVTVMLSDFAFEPDHLRLKTGEAVRLRLVNDSDGGHDFSAPAFFAASRILPRDGGDRAGAGCAGHLSGRVQAFSARHVRHAGHG